MQGWLQRAAARRARGRWGRPAARLAAAAVLLGCRWGAGGAPALGRPRGPVQGKLGWDPFSRRRALDVLQRCRQADRPTFMHGGGRARTDAQRRPKAAPEAAAAAAAAAARRAAAARGPGRPQWSAAAYGPGAAAASRGPRPLARARQWRGAAPRGNVPGARAPACQGYQGAAAGLSRSAAAASARPPRRAALALAALTAAAAAAPRRRRRRAGGRQSMPSPPPAARAAGQTRGPGAPRRRASRGPPWDPARGWRGGPRQGGRRAGARGRGAASRATPWRAGDARLRARAQTRPAGPRPTPGNHRSRQLVPKSTPLGRERGQWPARADARQRREGHRARAGPN